ncbi:hypothetical protein RB195_016093 [Necator americanus]|uniref:Neuropeptide-like protein 31 family protein n=1 Tax=Necator americanus TaxID=51031 RepID=A0ABR1E863_NECAM
MSSSKLLLLVLFLILNICGTEIDAQILCCVGCCVGYGGWGGYGGYGGGWGGWSGYGYGWGSGLWGKK